MKFLNKVKLFVILVSLFLVQNVSAELYRLADMRPSGIGGFFNSKVPFGVFGDVGWWMIALIWLFVFIIGFVKGFNRMGLNNRAAAIILSAITATVFVGSSYLDEFSIIVAIAIPVAIAGFFIVNSIRWVRGGGKKKYAATKIINNIGKNPEKKGWFKRMLNREGRTEKKLLREINKLRKELNSGPDKDDDKYEKWANAMSDEIASNINPLLERLELLETKMYRRFKSTNKASRKRAKYFKAKLNSMESAISSLKSGDSDGAADKIEELRREMKDDYKNYVRIVLREIEKLEGKVDELKEKIPGEPEESEGDEGLSDDDEEGEKEPVEKAEGPEFVKPENIIDSMNIGDLYGYKSNTGQEMYVEIKNKYPERNVVQVQNVAGGTIFAINPEQLYDVGKGGPQAVKSLKNYYDSLRKTAISLPEGSNEKFAVENTARKILKQLEKYGWSPS